MRPLYSLIASLLLLSACGEQERYPYTIKDFSPRLQPVLLEILNRGVAITARLDTIASEQELRRLSLSEHPLLRAEALFTLAQHHDLYDSSFLLTHLDDTAYVNADYGDLGQEYQRVSDVMIKAIMLFRDSAFIGRVLDTVMVHHSYLSSAYLAAQRLPRFAKYRLILKAMLSKYRPYNELEPALYVLATYRRAEDTAQVRAILHENISQLDKRSFSLIAENPVPSYFNVLAEFGQRYFNRIGATRSYDAGTYLKAVASYRNEEAERVLEQCLFRIRTNPVEAEQTSLELDLSTAVAEHPCPAFSALMPPARKYLDAYHRKYPEEKLQPLPEYPEPF